MKPLLVFVTTVPGHLLVRALWDLLHGSSLSNEIYSLSQVTAHWDAELQPNEAPCVLIKLVLLISQRIKLQYYIVIMLE